MNADVQTDEKNGFEVPYVCHNVHVIYSRGIWHGDNPLNYTVPSLMMQLSLISVITRCVYFALKPFDQPLIVSQILVSLIFQVSTFFII